MNYLIVGSKGFIGTYLTQYLRRSGHRVFECDVATYYGDNQYFQVDIGSPEYDDIFKRGSFDVCVNCSGAASVPDSFGRNLRDFQLNVANVYKLLNALKDFEPQCKFINLSSAAVYGNPISLPIAEGHKVSPISPYGFHKLLSEQILREFSEIYKINTISLRVFSAYGEGLRKQLIWDLFHKMRNNDHIELFGTGDETRDFIHIQDLSRIVAMIAEANVLEPIINVGNGQQVTIRHLANTFADTLGWNGKVTFTGTTKIGDPKFWQSDISVIQSLGYVQAISMQEGLNRCVKWMRKL